MSITERDIMGGLAKGLAVIETFGSANPRQSIAEVAAASGLDRATARRCLLTLAHHGYADWDGKFFTLTPRVLRLGTACLASMPMPAIVQPALDALSDRIGESTSVSILDGTEIVYVARAAQRKLMSISLMPGSRLPAYCTSMGRVLLAALPDAEARLRIGPTALPARTAFTLTDPAAIMAELARRDWRLSDIWITHHHGDHIDGIPELRAATGALVTGAAADAHRLPPLDLALPDEGALTLGRHAVETFPVPGHTVGHIAFHIPAAKLAFTGDSLMSAGCGRLFEGTALQMHTALQRLARLHPDTLVCSGHEYTAGNIRFALTLEPENAALIFRSQQVASLVKTREPTAQVTLAEELATNPFLRTRSAEIRANLAVGTASDAAVFAEIRSRKDSF